MICTLGPKGERVLQGLAQVPDEQQAFFRQQGVFPLQIADAEIPRNVQGDRDDIRRDKALAQAARAEAVAVCMDDEVVHRRPVFDEDLAGRAAEGEIAFRNIEKRIVLAEGDIGVRRELLRTQGGKGRQGMASAEDDVLRQRRQLREDQPIGGQLALQYGLVEG